MRRRETDVCEGEKLETAVAMNSSPARSPPRLVQEAGRCPSEGFLVELLRRERLEIEHVAQRQSRGFEALVERLSLWQRATGVAGAL